MWEWNSAVMQDAIVIHDNILRQRIAEHCGLEVMTEGDAFIVAFHDPYDALVYCMHVQVFAPLSLPSNTSACCVAALADVYLTDLFTFLSCSCGICSSWIKSFSLHKQLLSC
jgi:class 3 adenylate cyclase